MTKTTTWGLTATAAAALMLSMNAFAQTTPTAPPAGTPPPAATPKAAPAPAAPKTLTEKAKDVVKGAKDAVVKKVDDTKKAISACKGLDQTACGAKGTECQWIVPKKVDAKTGKADNPYCRKVAGVAKKAADKKAETTKAAAPAATKPATPPAAAPTAPTAPKKP